jgi:hypothetical protein
MIAYANWLLKNTSASNVVATLWPAIQLDLDYVAANWNQTGFDLWEEISSSSFFTTAVQHRSLREGVALATALGQTSVVSGYATQADNVLCFLQSYWNPTGAYITANTGGGRSGKDANTALASIHTFDPAAGCVRRGLDFPSQLTDTALGLEHIPALLRQGAVQLEGLCRCFQVHIHRQQRNRIQRRRCDWSLSGRRVHGRQRELTFPCLLFRCLIFPSHGT